MLYTHCLVFHYKYCALDAHNLHDLIRRQDTPRIPAQLRTHLSKPVAHRMSVTNSHGAASEPSG